jgi:hypothetical protein
VINFQQNTRKRAAGRAEKVIKEGEKVS